MPNLNRCEFIGHLGRDAETRYLSNGDPVVNVSMAVTDKWKGKDGEWKESTTWVNIVAFGFAAKNLADGIKGQPWYICGKLQNREWQDKEGKKRTTTEINAQEAVQLVRHETKQSAQPKKSAKPDLDDLENDLPWKD